jgi:hypothetical protein
MLIFELCGENRHAFEEQCKMLFSCHKVAPHTIHFPVLHNLPGSDGKTYTVRVGSKPNPEIKAAKLKAKQAGAGGSSSIVAPVEEEEDKKEDSQDEKKKAKKKKINDETLITRAPLRERWRRQLGFCCYSLPSSSEELAVFAQRTQARRSLDIFAHPRDTLLQAFHDPQPYHLHSDDFEVMKRGAGDVLDDDPLRSDNDAQEGKMLQARNYYADNVDMLVRQQQQQPGFAPGRFVCFKIAIDPRKKSAKSLSALAFTRYNRNAPMSANNCLLTTRLLSILEQHFEYDHFLLWGAEVLHLVEAPQFHGSLLPSEQQHHHPHAMPEEVLFLQRIAPSLPAYRELMVLRDKLEQERKGIADRIKTIDLNLKRAMAADDMDQLVRHRQGRHLYNNTSSCAKHPQLARRTHYHPQKSLLERDYRV